MTCTAAEVKAITGSTLDDSKIDPFITVANCLIETAAECAVVTDDCKDQACIYLSAHLLVTSAVGKASRELKREDLEDVYSRTYNASNASGNDVMSTQFGQTANMLMGGCLAELGKQPIGLFSIGAHPC